jgi:Holliday junction resolvase
MGAMRNMTKTQSVSVIKASGEREPFSESKLRTSLRNAGASQEAVESIVTKVADELRDGMTTKQIYSRAFSYLRRKERPTAGRYHLRMALIELGPSGHPFEQFVGKLLEAEGFSTEVAIVARGRCISHELDVVAHKGNEHIMVECKFHNAPNTKSDAKVALYVQARFEDIEKQWKAQPEHGTKLHGVWLVTNTKLTSDASDYAKCVGMRALGWNHPEIGSLQELVERHGLHPVTCLTLLNRLQKQELIRQKLILCRDLLNNQNVLQKVVGDATRTEEILHEVRGLTKAI